MVCEFFSNPPISSKSQCETETETQTRKHAHDPLMLEVHASPHGKSSRFPLGLEIGENLEKWEGIFQSRKSQGILPKILEKQENLNKKNVFCEREFYTKCWKISGFEKITVSRSYLILFSQTSQVSWHLFL